MAFHFIIILFSIPEITSTSTEISLQFYYDLGPLYGPLNVVTTSCAATREEFRFSRRSDQSMHRLLTYRRKFLMSLFPTAYVVEANITVSKKLSVKKWQLKEQFRTSLHSLTYSDAINRRSYRAPLGILEFVKGEVNTTFFLLQTNIQPFFLVLSLCIWTMAVFWYLIFQT